MGNVALVTGINGQDGSFLAELLLDKGYVVHGLIRRSSTPNLSNIQNILNHERLNLHYGDLTDASTIHHILKNSYPDEIYNLAAQSHVRISFDTPVYTGDVDGLGVARILEAMKTLNMFQHTKIYQASTSELYGKVQEVPQNEKTPFYPRSPYGIAKQYAYWMIKNYRESYNLFGCNGILFNHESERRGDNFVTRKITKSVAEIATGKRDSFELGNLDALRDWGYAKDFVYGMYLMMQQPDPDDYVLATGEMHSVREMVELSFKHVGKEIQWEGSELNEIGRDEFGQIRVRINPDFYRPAEVEQLLGDPTKAKVILNWEPKTSFSELVKLMIENDLAECIK